LGRHGQKTAKNVSCKFPEKFVHSLHVVKYFDLFSITSGLTSNKSSTVCYLTEFVCSVTQLMVTILINEVK